MKFNTKQVNNEILQKLYDGSACTQLGYMPEELHLYIKEMQEEGFLKDEEITVYTYSGKDLNNCFELEGNNRLSDTLNIFSIDLDQIENLGKFATSLRFVRGYRWLDDIIDNSR